jgi:hypothetical protein
MVKAEKGGLLHGSVTCHEKRQSKHSAHLHPPAGTDIYRVIGLSRQKNWEQGTKGVHKQSQSQVSSGCPLSRSKDSERGSGEDDITVIT